MDKGKDTRVPRTTCPSCKKKLDAAFSIKGRSPSEGDISICINCAEILVFGKDLILEEITDEIRKKMKAEGIWKEVVRNQVLVFKMLK